MKMTRRQHIAALENNHIGRSSVPAVRNTILLSLQQLGRVGIVKRPENEQHGLLFKQHDVGLMG
jgi:hypothetical protein